VIRPILTGVAFGQLPLRQTRLPDGLTFHHVEAGVGRPLVFVHGVLGDWRAWEPQWVPFSQHFRAISYSRRLSVPNQGNAFEPNHSAMVEAEDLLALLAAWGAPSAVLVGSSYGAFTALAAAVRSPGSVSALVLVEPPMLRWADLSEEGRQIKARFDAEIRQPAVEAFQRGEDARGVLLLTEGIVGPSMMATLPPTVIARRLENAAAMKALVLSSDEFPMIEPAAIRALPMPTLLLAGENTPLIHDVVFRALTGVMTQAEHARIAGAGHAAARDNPAEFNRLVLDFLARNGL
jgi:esterase